MYEYLYRWANGHKISKTFGAKTPNIVILNNKSNEKKHSLVKKFPNRRSIRATISKGSIKDN